MSVTTTDQVSSWHGAGSQAEGKQMIEKHACSLKSRTRRKDQWTLFTKLYTADVPGYNGFLQDQEC